MIKILKKSQNLKNLKKLKIKLDLVSEVFNQIRYKDSEELMKNCSHIRTIIKRLNINTNILERKSEMCKILQN